MNDEFDVWLKYGPYRLRAARAEVRDMPDGSRKMAWAIERFGRDAHAVLSLFHLMEGGWEPPWGAFEEFSLRAQEFCDAVARAARADLARLRRWARYLTVKKY